MSPHVYSQIPVCLRYPIVFGAGVGKYDMRMPFPDETLVAPPAGRFVYAQLYAAVRHRGTVIEYSWHWPRHSKATSATTRNATYPMAVLGRKGMQNTNELPSEVSRSCRLAI
jgi:hypothetical protein